MPFCDSELSVLIFLLLGIGVRTAPNPPAPSPSASLYAFPQIARFDNEPSTTPVVQASPAGIYDDILFNGMLVADNSLGLVAGILPQSPPNQLAYGDTVPATIMEGTPEMTTVYPDTTVVYFDLISFYFGCAANGENSAAAVATACTVTTICVNPDGKTVATESFSFTSSGGLTSNLVEAKPMGFKGCQYVTFTTSSDVASNLDVATALDTISYTVHSTLPLSP